MGTVKRAAAMAALVLGACSATRAACAAETITLMVGGIAGGRSTPRRDVIVDFNAEKHDKPQKPPLGRLF